MGTNHSKRRVLVIGLSGVGKTHFLDLFNGCKELSKKPTNGLYESSYGDEFHFVEYGGKSSWDHLFHDHYDLIYMFIDVNYTDEQMLNAKSAMIMMCQKLPKIPLIVILKGGKRKRDLGLLQLEHLNRRVGISHLNFDDDEECQEGISRLFAFSKSTTEERALGVG